MVKEISWEEFRNNGMLWLTNSILHNLGMAIAIDFDEGKAVRAYPARVKYRGFDEKQMTVVIIMFLDIFPKTSTHYCQNVNNLTNN